MHFAREIAVAAILFLSSAGAFYDTKGNPVITVTPKTFKKEVHGGSAVMVEYFAPWCGHCKNLKGAYEKAARSLENIAKFVAIDCDAHKSFCEKEGIRGFPTLKIFHPGNKNGETHEGHRSGKALADAVASRIPNHVTDLTVSKYEEFLNKDNKTAKAILFSNRKTNDGKPMPLWRSLAIEFKGDITFAQFGHEHMDDVRKKLGVTKFPTIVFLPGSDAEGIVFKGAPKRHKLVEFFSTSRKSKDTPVKMEEGETKIEDAEAEMPTETRPAEKPKPEVAYLLSIGELRSICFAKKSKTCILALSNEPGTLAAVDSMYERLQNRGPPFAFQIYKVLASDPLGIDVASSLQLASELPAVVAVNHRGWYRKFAGDVGSADELVAWTDAVKMGEGAKSNIPELLMVDEEVAQEEVQEKVEKKPKVEKPEEEKPEEKVEEEADIKDEL